MRREISFARWVAICVLLVWPLNVFFSHATTHGPLTARFTVHGALLGAIVALISAVRDLRHVHASKARVPKERWPHFRAAFASHWLWLLWLLPLLLSFRWNQSFSTTSRPAGGEAITNVTTTAFGWGHDASQGFAILVALALLAHVWRRRVEAAAAV